MRTPLVLLALATVGSAAAQLSFTGVAVSQNFDSLPNSGNVTRPTGGNTTASVAGNNWVNGTTLPGWFASFSNATNVGANPPAGTDGNFIQAGVVGSPNTIPTHDVRFFRIGTGSLATGAIYNAGAASGTDRALGSLNSGGLTTPLISSYGLVLTNDTGVTITEFTLSYLGKQFRAGTTDGTVDRIDFAHRTFDAGTFTIDGFRGAAGWTQADGLDFASPNNSNANTGALDTSLVANQTAKAATIGGITWTAGSVLAIRWQDFDKAGSDHGLAIDNVSFSAVPEPASMVVLGLGLAAFRRRRG